MWVWHSQNLWKNSLFILIYYYYCQSFYLNVFVILKVVCCLLITTHWNFIFIKVNMYKYWNVPWLGTRCKNKLRFVSKLMHRKKKHFLCMSIWMVNEIHPHASTKTLKNAAEILREAQQIHQAVHFGVSYVLPNILYVSQKFIPQE